MTKEYFKNTKEFLAKLEEQQKTRSDAYAGSTIEEKLAVAVEALGKVKAKETMCIYGSLDMPSDPQQAFQLGSNLAWIETGSIAKEALEKIKPTTQGE